MKQRNRWGWWRSRLFRYVTGPFWRSVSAVRRAWLAAFSDQHVLVEYEDLMELTTELDEHPESWDGPCNCALCRSYG